MKNTSKLIEAQFCERVKSEKTFAIILMGVALACYYSSFFLRFVNTVSLPINLAECYIINGSCRNSFTCTVLFGSLLLTSDAPYYSDRSIYEIARVGKQRWIISKILFLFFEVFLYNLIIFTATAIISLLSANDIVVNDWSTAMEWLVESGRTYALNNFGLSFPFQKFITTVPLWLAVCITYVLNSSYCLVLALAMMLCNTIWNGSRGWVIAVAIHILGYIISNNGHDVVFHFAFSLLDCALPAPQFSDYSWKSIINSTITFVIIITLLAVLTKRAGKRLIL